ncbi:J-domain-containing protein [Cellulomonas aerilata]|uniref:DnaJ homologue subfamily C member 28 conserved domain-containing protein n=1 Tax=Cellulomonas aerilata TaxID=515326 RepID=A0A512DBK7_9CELL|nr:DUF1992 domain-containing protein [Cellulomonas aerilata]GEO33835.1 hypothetical protein CAE01nite_15600 [Cellulomonas aerilata]
MEEQDPHRRAVRYRLDRLAERDAGGPPRGDAHAGADADTVTDAGSGSPDPGEETAPPGPRPPSMAARGAFADELVRQAMLRGEFDDLPLTGKPIPGLTGRHDPDWWLKAFIEREQITGVLPEALQLRKDDAALDDRLDAEHREEAVREILEEFNARVVEARRQLLGGPPVVTPTRDVDREVDRWRERRRVRAAAATDHPASRPATERTPWWRRSAGRTRRPEG